MTSNPSLPKITPKEFAKRMQEIFPKTGYDWEIAHRNADTLLREVLISLGYKDGIEIYENSGKWYA